MPLLTRILHVHKKEIGMCKFRRPFPLLPLILFIIYAFGVVFKLFATFPSYTIGYRVLPLFTRVAHSRGLVFQRMAYFRSLLLPRRIALYLFNTISPTSNLLDITPLYL